MLVLKKNPYIHLNQIQTIYLNKSESILKNISNAFKITTKNKRSDFSKEVLLSLKNEYDIRPLEILFQRHYGSLIWNYQLIESLKQKINFNVSNETMELVGGNYDNISLSSFCNQSIDLFNVIEFNLDNQTFLSKLNVSLKTQDQFKNFERIFIIYLETKNLSVFYYQIKINEMEQHCIFYRIFNQWIN